MLFINFLIAIAAMAAAMRNHNKGSSDSEDAEAGSPLHDVSLHDGDAASVGNHIGSCAGSIALAKRIEVNEGCLFDIYILIRRQSIVPTDNTGYHGTSSR